MALAANLSRKHMIEVGKKAHAAVRVFLSLSAAFNWRSSICLAETHDCTFSIYDFFSDGSRYVNMFQCT